MSIIGVFAGGCGITGLLFGGLICYIGETFSHYGNLNPKPLSSLTATEIRIKGLGFGVQVVGFRVEAEGLTTPGCFRV